MSMGFAVGDTPAGRTWVAEWKPARSVPGVAFRLMEEEELVAKFLK
jgi:hypothetical protein